MTHIVTVCPLGKKIENTEDNSLHITLLNHITEMIVQSQWNTIDAVLFPGGYLFVNMSIGHLDTAARKHALQQEEFHNAAIAACKRISAASPNCHVIIGIDTFSPKGTIKSDQLCVAWNSNGIEGIGRKIFTSDADTKGAEHLICYADDFKTDDRIITLASGAKAVLCACYDMFGIAESTENRTGRTGYIRYISNNYEVITARTEGFKTLRSEVITSWQQLLEKQQVSVALCAIHGFDKPGREVFWQRHGIAAASASLDGLAIGAGHFVYALPKPESATLAAYKVPKRHLSEGLHRKSHELKPIASFIASVSEDNQALVRLYKTK